MTRNCDTGAAQARILEAALPLVRTMAGDTPPGKALSSGQAWTSAKRAGSFRVTVWTLRSSMKPSSIEYGTETGRLRLGTGITALPRSRRPRRQDTVRSVKPGSFAEKCAYFALPHHAAPGAHALWKTADTIWNALNDTSRDVNWYTKRMLLSEYWGRQACSGSATIPRINRKPGNFSTGASRT